MSESKLAEAWHAPGLGEVHSNDHVHTIYCYRSDDDLEQREIPDDALAKRVCEALAANDARKGGEWIKADDVHTLVRRLDIALNGNGAAEQASLCDIVSQAEQYARTHGPLIDARKGGGVSEAMLDRALNAIGNISDSRLPRSIVVRKALEAAGYAMNVDAVLEVAHALKVHAGDRAFYTALSNKLTGAIGGSHE